MLLAQQPVATPAAHDVQGVAHVEQPPERRVDRAVGAVGEPGPGQGVEHGDVADPAEGLLEVGFDLLAEVPVAMVPGPHRLEELRQPGAGTSPPVVGDGGAHAG